jgi:hypothetical protein
VVASMPMAEARGTIRSFFAAKVKTEE